MNKEKENIIHKLIAHQEQLTDFGVDQIGLFGSFQRGDASTESDIDILVNIKKEKKLLEILWHWLIF